ncbi:MAG TPA: alpha/beta hydrolase [Devosiaceae bacterium]|jgi:pimeloyl-ACP methyl ester carboxylesterase|nr:alpha/beta hydrolase [Devosiaceae bacterium]
MPTFLSDGISLSYEVFGDGKPILLIHGFASNVEINWVSTGWVEALNKAGYRVIALDNRGHGKSQKLYSADLYFAHEMAEDARRLLDHLGIERVPVIGYSMGARIAAFLALRHPDRVSAAVFGGMGINLITGLVDTEAIIEALTADSLSQVTDKAGRQFRIFAEHSGADRPALAACMIGSREPMREADARKIEVPVLVAVGGEDDMARAAEPLAQILPHGEAFTIPRRDHMRATGDFEFKQAALAFLARQGV